MVSAPLLRVSERAELPFMLPAISWHTNTHTSPVYIPTQDLGPVVFERPARMDTRRASQQHFASPGAERCPEANPLPSHPGASSDARGILRSFALER